jgi:hypothetical protein
VNPTVTIIAAVILAVAVMAAAWLFARRAEHAASRAKASATNAKSDAAVAVKARQQTEGMVAAFRNGRPSEVDYRPTCPMDGEPLRGYTAEDDKPVRYVHMDGRWHGDRSSQLQDTPVRTALVFDPPPQAPPPMVEPMVTGGLFTPAQPPGVQAQQPASTVDTYFQRVSAGIDSGLIDPDALRTGVAHITRNDFDPTAESTAERRTMPDPTRAARVSRSRPQGPAGPQSQNGDGS